MPYLIHHHNGSAIGHVELQQSLTIGRAQGNDLQIDDATISGEHAVVESIGDGGYRIRDLGSTNGLLYKGKKVDEMPLSDGEFVVVGTHDLQYVLALPEPLQRTAKIKKSWIPGVFYTLE